MCQPFAQRAMSRLRLSANAAVEEGMTRVVEPFREYTAWFRKVRQLLGKIKSVLNSA